MGYAAAPRVAFIVYGIQTFFTAIIIIIIIITDQIKIKRGIFQGDSFSPLLFCLALVPLTSELVTSGYGYKISNTSAPISNLFYMDNLKL